MCNKYIIGIGNDLMGDDAIGLRVIDAIDSFVGAALVHASPSKVVDQRTGYETVRLGNAILNLISYISSNENKVLIVDCAYIGLEPGEYRIYKNLDNFLLESFSQTSTHGATLCQIINLVRTLNGAHSIPPIHVLAIQPEYVENVYGVSMILCNRLSEYCAAAIEEIETDWV